jgi:hypothetical protein
MANSKIKTKSTKHIYQEYFELINSYFGSIKHHLSDDEDSHISLGNKMSKYYWISDLLIDATDEISRDIKGFWNRNHKYVRNNIINENGLKCLYSGDLSPVNLEKFIKRSSLYVDTVIMPDPLYNLSVITKPLIKNKKVYLNKLIRHVFNIWKLENLVLADVKDNIIIPFPVSINAIAASHKEQLVEDARNTFIKYISEIFDREFASVEEIFEFLDPIETNSDLFKSFKNKDVLPNRFKILNSLNENMNVLLSVLKQSYALEDIPSTGGAFAQYVHSQFIRVKEHNYFCEQFQAEPIYDYDLPWSFFTYDMGGLDLDAAISNALQSESFTWIGNVPLNAIKIFREEGKLEYMRETLRKGILSITAKKDSDLSLIIDQLQDNFAEAFERQKSEVSKLESDVKKIAKKSIPITILGFILGFIPYIGNYISLPFNAKGVLDSVNSYKSLKDDIKDKKTASINLLMQAYDK